jgi:hypothetical protein
MKENGTLPDFNKQTTDISARVDGILWDSQIIEPSRMETRTGIFKEYSFTISWSTRQSSWLWFENLLDRV